MHVGQWTRRVRVAAVGLAALCHLAYAGETTNRLGITMVDIPAGEFVMGACRTGSCLAGSPDENARDSETPQLRVRVKAFQLGKTEVTLGQFKLFIAAENRMDILSADFLSNNTLGDDAPVVSVSWDDAQAFIAWLNKTDGKGWRLPSEAEWEYACRAGQRHTYCGSDNIDDVAWYDGNTGKRKSLVGGEKVQQLQRAVGQKRPNAWGLYDMSGNVWEWVQDCWHPNHMGAPVDGSAWTGGCDDADVHVLRGGAGDDIAEGSHAHARFDSWGGMSNRGFRLAKTR